MKDWKNKLNDFITLNDKEILEHSGQISAQIAKELSEAEFEKYRINKLEENDIMKIQAIEEEIKRIDSKQKGDNKS